MASAGDNMRIFYGVFLDDALCGAVADLQRRLQQDAGPVKWVEPHNLHFTLRFIGDTPTDRIAEFVQAGRAAAGQCHAFDMHLCGAGAFPTPANPRTVWLGVVAGAEQMTDLHDALSRSLDEAGLASPEDRPYAPHCTLGRVRETRRNQALAAAIAAHAGHDIGPMRCEQFCLIRSRLHRTGPTYEAVETFALQEYN